MSRLLLLGILAMDRILESTPLYSEILSFSNLSSNFPFDDKRLPPCHRYLMQMHL